MPKGLIAYLRRDQRGATMIEYALLVALIALAMLAAFSPMADRC